MALGWLLVICWVVFMDVDRMPALARNSPRAQQREKLQTKSRGRRVQARAPGAMSAAVASHRHRQGQLVICSHRRRERERALI